MRRRILILAQDVALRARLARAMGAADYALELAESAAHARRIDRKGLALAVVVPAGLERDADALIAELRACSGGVLLVRDAADEANLPARAAETLKPRAALEEAAPVLCFAGYRLDMAGHSLTDASSTAIPLSPGEFALLLALVQRAGRVLSRDQLLQMLAGRDAEPYDRSVDMQIFRLRRKIEPDPKQPSLIVTVPGSGYKFAAEVMRSAAIPVAVPAASAPAAPAARGSGAVATPEPAPGAAEAQGETSAVSGGGARPELAPPASLAPRGARNGKPARARLYGAVGVLAVAICVAVVWRLLPADHAQAPAIPSVAVLPFDNLSGDKADARLADGITEDIITDLSRDREFAVIARDSSEVYKGKPMDVRQIGKDLNVTHVLEGSFQRDGGQVRITAQLIDTATGTHIWSERYDRPADQVFAVQTDVANRILDSLGGPGGRVSGSVLVAAKRKRPTDLGAYELLLLGREKMHVGLTEESQVEATRLLKQAISIDSHFARAYATLAWTYAWRITYEADAVALVREMLDAARRAVELDPLDADAHQALGYAHGMNGALSLSETEFDEALRLNPNSFSTLTVYACWAHNFGKAKAGAEAVDRAIRLNPNFPAWAIPCFRLGFVMVGRYEDAVKVQQREPENLWNTDGFAITAGSLAMLGRVEEAKALAARGVAQFPGLLSVEKFALNRQWAPAASRILADLMRKAGFPLCAADKDLAGIANPARLSECVHT